MDGLTAAFCLTVASLGTKYSAELIPSKPTTEMSSGTFFPMSINALIAPMAIRSLIANTAVISGYFSMSFFAALYPLSIEKRE